MLLPPELIIYILKIKHFTAVKDRLEKTLSFPQWNDEYKSFTSHHYKERGIVHNWFFLRLNYRISFLNPQVHQLQDTIIHYTSYYKPDQYDYLDEILATENRASWIRVPSPYSQKELQDKKYFSSS